MSKTQLSIFLELITRNTTISHEKYFDGFNNEFKGNLIIGLKGKEKFKTSLSAKYKNEKSNFSKDLSPKTFSKLI